MNITGVGKGGNPYLFSVRKAECEKAEDAKTEQLSQTDTVSVSKSGGAAYYETLRENFPCVKNGSVSISGAFLDQCAKDPDTAKRLEKNLAAYNDYVQRGCQDAEIAARAAHGKLISYSEAWDIDSEGNLTIIFRGTVEYDTGTESWEDIRKDTLDRVERGEEDEEREQQPLPADTEEESEEVSRKQGGRVAVNENKRARQIVAAATKEQVQQVLTMLQKDLSDCKAGLEQGMCDESEIAKVEALMSRAKARLSQVPKEADLENPQESLSAFLMASLM